MNNKNRVCPVEIAGSLDNKIRRWLQNPAKILKPFIKEGMTVLDVGCGPGFFTVAIAELVGRNGKVLAADLQEGMLQKLQQKIRGTEIEERIKLHKSEQNKIGITEKVDFIPGGLIFIVEPKFHVSKKAFEEMVKKVGSYGLTSIENPKLPLSRTVLLKN